MKKGRNYVATKINAASKLIKIEETGAALPDVRVAAGHLHAVGAVGGGRQGQAPATSKATSPRGAAWATPRRSTRSRCSIMPDVVSLNGDGAQMRDLQGKMIAHAELMGDRMAILDTPDGLHRPGGARVADEHRRL